MSQFGIFSTQLQIIFFNDNSSSSCRAASTDVPDPFSPPLPIIHRFRQVLWITSRILTELLYIGSSWPLCFCSAMWRGLLEYITYELVPTSQAVPPMSGWTNFNNFRDGLLVAVYLLLCVVLFLGLIQYCSQHSCVVAVKIFLQPIS